jgi:hypothetical protein
VLVGKSTPGRWHLEVEAEPEIDDLPEVYVCHAGTVCDQTVVARMGLAGQPRHTHQQRQDAAALIVALVNAAPALLDTAERVGRLEEALGDPATVHVNMLRGGIAKPSPASIWHLYGDEALVAAMPVSARALLAGHNQNSGERSDG